MQAKHYLRRRIFCYSAGMVFVPAILSFGSGVLRTLRPKYRTGGFVALCLGGNMLIKHTY